FKGDRVHENKTSAQLKEFNQNMQMIFQDPYASLNPRMTVTDIVAEGLDIHGLVKSKIERKERVNALLETDGLSKEHRNRYQNESSGGERQCIGIARELAVDAVFMVNDELI